jgi:hypothetical protein
MPNTSAFSPMRRTTHGSSRGSEWDFGTRFRLEGIPHCVAAEMVGHLSLRVRRERSDDDQEKPAASPPRPARSDPRNAGRPCRTGCAERAFVMDASSLAALRGCSRQPREEQVHEPHSQQDDDDRLDHARPRSRRPRRPSPAALSAMATRRACLARIVPVVNPPFRSHPRGTSIAMPDTDARSERGRSRVPKET